jgi:hypothetical protein
LFQFFGVILQFVVKHFEAVVFASITVNQEEHIKGGGREGEGMERREGEGEGAVGERAKKLSKQREE